jgi:hypothetical protein
VEITTETSNFDVEKLLAAAKAMQKTRAEAEAGIAELTSDSDLLAEATYWAKEADTSREPILHVKLCLASIQTAVRRR